MYAWTRHVITTHVLAVVQCRHAADQWLVFDPFDREMHRVHI
jgi:hypothetical protein